MSKKSIIEMVSSFFGRNGFDDVCDLTVGLNVCMYVTSGEYGIRKLVEQIQFVAYVKGVSCGENCTVNASLPNCMQRESDLDQRNSIETTTVLRK